METRTAAALELKLADRPGEMTKDVGASLVAVRPLLTTLCMVAADGLALALSAAISAGIQVMFGQRAHLALWGRAWPLLFVFLAVFTAVRLYSLVGLNAPEELRRSTIATGLLIAITVQVAVFNSGAAWYREWPLFLAATLSIALVPLVRAVARERFGRSPWWGYPAVIIGTGKAAQNLIREMRQDVELGLKPVAIIEDREFSAELDGLPVFGTTCDPTPLRELWFPYMIAAANEMPQHRIIQVVRRRHLRVSGILLVQDFHALSSLHVNMRKVGGMFALELPHEHALQYRHAIKRFADLVLTLIIGVLALPVCLAIAAAISTTSAGPVLYGQRRIGRHGQSFKAWKFRSMVVNADEALQKHLEQNTAARAEWAANQKLRDDPRVTPVGKFLRSASLDELPQLWNILVGQMSLVGPRPIVDAEVVRYGESIELYKNVRGGLTGLWQVSGRNDTSYEERVRLDKFYVQNCSIWLDLCILFRTFGIVLLRKGAY
jgi:Undecaprenyl-phosphate galactose phosphotransferase WbaP